jgi:hypothetical protein
MMLRTQRDESMPWPWMSNNTLLPQNRTVELEFVFDLVFVLVFFHYVAVVAVKN